ncbi:MULTISPECIES: DUF397 domain-containing protein [Streptomyces]|uniref:DUF397 domain-containing protein n=1 Tax=Streptomyces TaxID=1883 RepID=UPI000D1C0026|nr:DUF397 domain-containing protein [Streptomyces kasugaensis]
MELGNGVQASAIPGVTWIKSRMTMQEGQCVELAVLPDGRTAVRNSRHPDGPALVYTKEEMIAFFDGVKKNEFDYLTR